MTQSLSLLPSSGIYSSTLERLHLVVVQIIKVILQPKQVLLIIPHECTVEMELWHHGLILCHDDPIRHRNFLLWDHLHRPPFIDLFRHGSRRHRRWRCSDRGCGGISSVVSILFFFFLIFILTCVFLSHLPSDLRDLH
jgi:hypothetical protein